MINLTVTHPCVFAPDPFAIFNTSIAAAVLTRRFIGTTEASEEYVSAAKVRFDGPAPASLLAARPSIGIEVNPELAAIAKSRVKASIG